MTMNQDFLNKKFNAYKTRLETLLLQLQQLALDIGGREQHEIARNLSAKLNEPFLFVVVGEVKSGKSSFINALLQEDVCKVDPAPCTDRVQQIVYAEKNEERESSQHFTRLGRPLEILKTIAIVDTPGTNTVIEHHQEITEKFIPYSDLVIFVFPARNPHTLSAWNLLAFVSAEWHRKVIFVLQQADTASAHELDVNLKSVNDYAKKKSILAPQIFCTSAKWEAEKDARSGFEQIRAFIRETVTGGRHYGQKLQANAAAAEQVAGSLKKNLDGQKEQLDIDLKAQEKIQTRLSLGKDKSTYEIDALIQLLVSNYNRIANYIKEDFREGLSLTSIISKSLAAIFKQDKSIETWIASLRKHFEEKLTASIEEISRDGARHFMESINLLLHDLLAMLENSKLPRSREIDLLTKVGESRLEVIDDVASRVANLMKDESFINALMPAMTMQDVGKAFVGGSSLAVLGTIIALSTKAMFLDITGGAVAASGLAIAGGTLFARKKSIIKKFNEDLDKNEERFAAELRSKLTAKLKLIYDRIDREFEPLYQHVDQEKRRILPLVERNEALLQQLRKLSEEISAT
jgi:ribosome biogenesis GTPase A